MEQEINVTIFYVSSTAFVGLVSLFGWFLYSQKKKEGISYRAAIFKITSFVKQRYNREDAIEQFCEDYNVPEKQSFLQAINSEGREILIPQIIGDVLNQIGYRVHLVNKVYYLQNPA